MPDPLSACREVSLELAEHATDPAADLSLSERWALVRLAIAIEVAAAGRAAVEPQIGDGIEYFREAVERADRREHPEEPTLPEA